MPPIHHLYPYVHFSQDCGMVSLKRKRREALVYFSASTRISWREPIKQHWADYLLSTAPGSISAEDTEGA